MASDDEAAGHPALTRRAFCQAVGVSACAVASIGAAAVTVEFLRPRALFEPATTFTVGPPDSIEIGAVLDFTEHRAFVMRLADGFRALSSVCTHLGCITRYQPDQHRIACPCHGSRFSLEGEVLAGPAPRPLRWLEMFLSDKGLVMVDTAVEVPLGTVFRL